MKHPRLSTKWLVSAPPMLFLLSFFLLPALIMVAASFREPGEFGGLAPLTTPDGSSTLTLEVNAVSTLLMALTLSLITLALRLAPDLLENKE